MDTARTGWHDHPALVASLRTFHEQYARQPLNDITEAKQTHKRYIDILETELKAMDKCSRIEYTGSSYEGVKVSNDIEFDIMVIIPVKVGEVDIEPESPGFSKLRVHSSNQQQLRFRDYLETDSLLLSPERTTKIFLSILQKCINKNTEMRTRIIWKRKPQTPSIQMDVYRNTYQSDEKPWYFVDVVPTFEIEVPGLPEKRCFVAKPGAAASNYSWRVSFSIQEKALFAGIDRDNGCRKPCIRILKVLRNKEAGLRDITSYHMKTALFYLNRTQLDWKPPKMAARVIDLLTFLRDAAKRGVLRHYFIPQINILDGISQSSLQNITNRLTKLITNENQFKRAICTSDVPS